MTRGRTKRGSGASPWRAWMTLVGTAIGAGIFAVPYTFAHAGIWLGLLYTLAIGLVFSLLYLLFAETILRSPGSPRLPGVVRRYLGPRWAGIAAASSVIGFWGALLAYLLLGGTFLSVVLDPIGFVPLFAARVLFYVLCGAVVFAGLRGVARAEFWGTIALLGILLAFLLLLIPQVGFQELPSLRNADDLFAPYGVLLFALAGTAAIPAMRDLLKGEEKRLPRIILGGNAMAVFLTALFGVLVVGVSGASTSEDAIHGLVPFFGHGIIYLGAVFGLLAVATSFFSNGLYLRDVFRLDYKFSPAIAGLLALGPPVLAFFLGAQRFVTVIGFVGAIFGAFDTILICRSYFAARKKRGKKPAFSLDVSPLVLGLLAAAVSLGLVVTLALL